MYVLCGTFTFHQLFSPKVIWPTPRATVPACGKTAGLRQPLAARYATTGLTLRRSNVAAVTSTVASFFRRTVLPAGGCVVWPFDQVVNLKGDHDRSRQAGEDVQQEAMDRA